MIKSADQIKKDSRDNPESKTINRHSAQYVKAAFKSGAKNYADHNYLIAHNGASMFVTFREKYYHQYPAENWSAVQDLNEFNKILASLKFLI